MSETRPIARFENKAGAFERLYPKGTYREISLEEIPRDLQSRVEERALRHSAYPEEKRSKISYFTIALQDGSSIFGAKYISEYIDYTNEEDEQGNFKPRIRLSEPCFYFFEVNSHGDEVGRGGIRYFRDPSLNTDIPIVDYVETPFELRGIGIGMERYRLMSALARSFYGKNLHSSLAISPEAESVWKDFTAQGEAEIVDTYVDDEKEEHHRYRLLTPL